MMKRRKKNRTNFGTITVQIVRAANFKRITKQQLTKFEESIVEKYYFDGDQIIPAIRYEPMSREENASRNAQGLPPRVLKLRPAKGKSECAEIQLVHSRRNCLEKANTHFN